MAVDILASYEKSPINVKNGQRQTSSKAEKRLQDGILPQEGIEAFRRILSHAVTPQVIVSPRDIQALQAESLTPLLDLEDEDSGQAPPSSTPHQRPNLQTPYVPPQNETEQQIAAIWQKMLGIEQIGIHD